MSIKREITEAVRPPRALFLRWPFGRPFGEPDMPDMQLTVLMAALGLFERAEAPGHIEDAPWRWRRHTFRDPLLDGAGD